MAATVLISAGGINFPDTTRFTPLVSPLFAHGTEGVAEQPIRDTGTFRNLYARISSNTVSNTTIIVLRKSAADTALSVSIASGATGVFEDTSGSATFGATTDEACWKVAIPPEAGNPVVGIILLACEFEADSNTVCLLRAGNANAGGVSSQTTRFMLAGGKIVTSWPSSEADQKVRIRASFTSRNFSCYSSQNTRGTDATVRTRKNGANGGQSVTVPASTTGAFEDASGSDSLVAGDDFNYSFTTGSGAGEFEVDVVQVTMVSTGGLGIFSVGESTPVDYVFNSTLYEALSGELMLRTTESSSQIVPRADLTLSELVCRVATNTIATDPSTITLRDGGNDGNLGVSIGAGATGLFSDTTDSDVITAGADTVNYKLATPNTSGTLSMAWIALLAEAEGAAFARPLIFVG